MKNEASAIGFIGGARGTTEIILDNRKVKEAEDIFAQYAPILKPNKKPVTEILEYIKSKYSTEEGTSARSKKVVEMTVLGSFYTGKSPDEIPMDITVLYLKNEGSATSLYDLQEQEYMNLVTTKMIKDFEVPFISSPIRIGAERITDYMFVDGSQALADEIVIMRGLDEKELQNKYQVANYIQTLRKFKLIE